MGKIGRGDGGRPATSRSGRVVQVQRHGAVPLGCGVKRPAARMCVETRKGDDGILGYPATLLLLSITDAIGHGLDVGSEIGGGTYA
jgi:hypothetical protein